MTAKRLVLILSLLLIALMVTGQEIRHYLRFSDLVGYGWHVDVQKKSVDIGIPGIKTDYAVWLTNYTMYAHKFEGRMLPGGYVGSGVVYRDRIERWDANQHRWVTVRETLPSDMKGYPLVGRRVWPGESLFAYGWGAVAAMDGINKGDIVRILIFSSFTKGDADQGQRVFYSPQFPITEQSAPAGSP